VVSGIAGLGADMPLKNGQWVKLKNHATYGTVVEQRLGNSDLPGAEKFYKIHVEQLERTLFYPESDLEVSAEPPPEQLSFKEQNERYVALANQLLESNPPYDPVRVKELLDAWKNLHKGRGGAADR
jgi:hypothetical protein